MVRRKKICVLLLAASLLFGTAAKGSAFVLGDVDDDGVVRLADSLLVLRYFAGTSSLSNVQVDACNVNGDGSSYDLRGLNPKCDIADFSKILSQAYGIITF